MNPCKSPTTVSGKSKVELGSVQRGPICPFCGSYKTSVDSVLKTSPSIIAVMLFGWNYMLMRGAFAKRSSMCHECGEINRYKSVGSKIAMVAFVGLLGLLVFALIS